MLTRAGAWWSWTSALPGTTPRAAASVSGTPAYMAPEQRAARPSMPGRDVYAAGVVLGRNGQPGRHPSMESRRSVWEGVALRARESARQPVGSGAAIGVATDRERRLRLRPHPDPCPGGCRPCASKAPRTSTPTPVSRRYRDDAEYLSAVRPRSRGVAPSSMGRAGCSHRAPPAREDVFIRAGLAPVALRQAGASFDAPLATGPIDAAVGSVASERRATLTASSCCSPFHEPDVAVEADRGVGAKHDHACCHRPVRGAVLLSTRRRCRSDRGLLTRSSSRPTSSCC